MLDERKLAVLRAVVTDYVETHEPVGSKTLVERHGLDVSPATVRNDMAVLEEEGYLIQPHTSAGRVPTDKGYRLFVDKLTSLKPLSAPQRRAIASFLTGAVDVGDIVRRTVRLLAQITHQVAMVQYPISSQASIRHVEMISLAPTRVLLILIDSAGLVEQRVISPGEVSEQRIAQLRELLNARLVGCNFQAAHQVLAELELVPGDEALRLVCQVLDQMMAPNQVSEVVVAGVPNLARFGAEYETTVKPVLEALEEQVVLLRLLGEAAGPPGEVAVRIGQENPYQRLQSTSLIASTYARPEDAYATLGIVGPIYMDYASTMAAVRAVARYVGRFLAEG